MAVKVAIVEDHAILRDLLKIVCERDLGFAVVGCAARGKDGVDLILRKLPKLVILDLTLPDFDGFQVAERVRFAGQNPKFLGISARCDPYTVHRVELAKFDGFLDKSRATPADLSHAIAALGAGRRYFSPAFTEIQKELRSSPRSFPKLLTARQQQILSLMSALLSDQEIGAQLQIAPETVEKHRFRIMRRLGLATKAQLLRYAVSTGFAPFIKDARSPSR